MTQNSTQLQLVDTLTEREVYENVFTGFDMERCYPQDFETFGTEAPEPTLIAVFLWHMAEKIRNTPKQSTASLIKQVLKDKGEEYTAITGRSSKMIRSYITAWVASNNVDSLRQQQGVDHLDQMALSYYIEERNKGVVQNIGKLPVGTLVMVPFGFRHFDQAYRPGDRTILPGETDLLKLEQICQQTPGMGYIIITPHTQ